jgi:signal transduction histidine kinase
VKIRQRLALRFTVSSALITGAILLFIYVLTRSFVLNDFIERLGHQSKLEAFHYATPEIKEVTEDETLPTASVVSIFSPDGRLLYLTGSYAIPRDWVGALNRNTSFLSTRDDYTTVGRKYKIKGKTYLVFVSDKQLPEQQEFSSLIKGIIVGWVASLILSYLAGWYFSRDALTPVNRVVKEVNQITKDNLSYRLKIKKDSKSVDEIDELILTFNALLSRIENAFIAQKRFVQNASHELKTPLTAIMAELELALARERSQEEYKRTMEVITQETERLATITQGLLSLARLEEGDLQSELEKIDVQALVHETLTTFRLHHPGREIIEEPIDRKVLLKGNAQLLQIALLNILDNAAKYSTDKIIFSSAVSEKTINIGVQDFGIGIPSQELKNLLSPLFRGSNARRISGAGLGLPLVDRIISVHSGHLKITSNEGEGTFCEITLPITV